MDTRNVKISIENNDIKKASPKKKSTKEKMDNFYKAKVDNFEVCPISVSTLVHELKCSQNIDRLI